MGEETRRALRPEDLNDIKFLGEVQLTPDGKQLYYDVSYIDQVKNSYRGQIWYTNLGEKSPAGTYSSQPVTSGTRRDSSPRLSPDGQRLAFLSDRGEGSKKQIYVLNLSGPGEARPVSDFQSNVTAFCWSPDNRSVVAVVETPDDKQKALACAVAETAQARKEREAREAEAARIGGEPVTFTESKLRFNGRRTLIPTDAHVQLWQLDVTGESVPRQLTTGTFNVASPAFSPDGRFLVFSSTRDQHQADFTSISDLWLIEPASSDLTPRKLTASAGPASNPRWSPDGERLAFVGHTNPKDGSHQELARAWVMDIDSNGQAGTPRCLTANFDYHLANLLNSDLMVFGEAPLGWSQDGQKLYFPASQGASTRLFEVSVDDQSEPRALTAEKQHLYAYSFAPQHNLVAYAAASPLNPGDIFVQPIEPDSQPIQVSRINEKWLGGVRVTQPEVISVPCSDGSARIEGWVLKPANFDPARKYPLLLEIHGGPHTAYGYSFNYEFQMLAGQDMVVLYTNPRGSIGYGYDFAAAIHNNWGGPDYEDVMAAVDHVVGLGYIDETRMGVTGGSYGGYMTNWIVTHTDRFKAALTQRCVSNLTTMYTLSDIHWTFIESEFDGDLWSNPRLWERSPIAHANKARTPLLMLHSDADYRCPVEQAEEFYFALKRVGCPVELVKTPNEDHDLSRNGSPDHRIGRLRRISNWFEKHLKEA